MFLSGNKLSDACKEQAFNRSVADIDRWISEVENALSSDDIGKDVATVTSLIKKHQVLEVEVQIHKVSLLCTILVCYVFCYLLYVESSDF